MKIDSLTICILVLLLIGAIWVFISGTCKMNCKSCGICASSESFSQDDHYLMSNLPWVVPPTGIGALGEIESKLVRKKYPGQRFSIGDIPISCPSKECPNLGVRIYETGNALNPNVQSYI